jgi:hypothetical protein
LKCTLFVAFASGFGSIIARLKCRHHVARRSERDSAVRMVDQRQVLRVCVRVANEAGRENNVEEPEDILVTAPVLTRPWQSAANIPCEHRANNRMTNCAETVRSGPLQARPKAQLCRRSNHSGNEEWFLLQHHLADEDRLTVRTCSILNAVAGSRS